MPESPAPLLLLDVGGTDIKAALTHGEAHAVGPVTRVPVVAHGDAAGEALAEQLASVAADLLDGARPGAVGLLVPGIVDSAAGLAVFSSNLGLRNAAVPAALETRLGAPVALGHDVGMAAEAELAFGVGRDGAASTLVVVIGTGIASTAFVGADRIDVPGAGELGHVPVPGGLPCACGATGCLETIASAAGIARAYALTTGESVGGAAAVLERARRGDAAAQAAWTQAVEALAFALNWCVGLLGVDRVVIGGGLSEAGEELLAPLREALSARLSFMPLPQIVKAKLGGDAGLAGARLLALSAAGAAAANGDGAADRQAAPLDARVPTEEA